MGGQMWSGSRVEGGGLTNGLRVLGYVPGSCPQRV